MGVAWIGFSRLHYQQRGLRAAQQQGFIADQVLLDWHVCTHIHTHTHTYTHTYTYTCTHTHTSSTSSATGIRKEPTRGWWLLHTAIDSVGQQSISPTSSQCAFDSPGTQPPAPALPGLQAAPASVLTAFTKPV